MKAKTPRCFDICFVLARYHCSVIIKIYNNIWRNPNNLIKWLHRIRLLLHVYSISADGMFNE